MKRSKLSKLGRGRLETSLNVAYDHLPFSTLRCDGMKVGRATPKGNLSIKTEAVMIRDQLGSGSALSSI